jgi:AcrR family transcriptional regulator
MAEEMSVDERNREGGRTAEATPPSSDKNSYQRGEILRAAATLFAERGFGGTKLHEIAAAVGLTRTAFYYYFDSKEQLLSALIEEITFVLQRRSAGIVERSDIAAPIMLRTLVRDYAGWILSHPVEFRFVSRTEFELPEEMAVAHDRAKRQLLDSFITIIRQGVDTGHFTVGDPRTASLSIIGMCNWSAWWFQPSGSLTAEQVAESLVEYAMLIVRAGSHPRSKKERVSRELESLRDSVTALERLLGSAAGSKLTD